MSLSAAPETDTLPVDRFKIFDMLKKQFSSLNMCMHIINCPKKYSNMDDGAQHEQDVHVQQHGGFHQMAS